MDFLVSDVVHYCNVVRKELVTMNKCSVPYYDLTFVISGRLEYVVDNVTYCVNAGDALIFPPNTKRRRNKTKNSVHYVSFNFSLFKDVEINNFLLKNVIGGEIVNIVCAYPFSHLSDFYYSKEKCASILNYILYEIQSRLQAFSSKNEHIDFLLKYISENLSKPITLKSAAETLKLSKEYTAYLFKKETNKTFTAFLNDVRLDMARDMIINSNLTLNEIANATGFENYNYFSRLFSKKFNITAVKLRKTAKK